jgi:hypothetical protein
VLAEDNIEAISVVAGSMNMANETLSYLLSTHFFFNEFDTANKNDQGDEKGSDDNEDEEEEEEEEEEEQQQRD